MCGASLAGHPIAASRVTENSADPVFSPSGPDAERYGAAQGFPVPNSALAPQQGNPYQPKYRVGAFSHFDEIYPTRLVKRAAMPSMYKRTPVDFRYRFQEKQSSLSEYLSQNPVTGLLIAARGGCWRSLGISLS